SLLLGGHSCGQLGLRAIAPKDGKLAGVNPRGAIFARLVDPQHGIAIRAAIARMPVPHARRPLSVRIVISPAPPSDRIAFHPAIEIPRKRNWTSSQRTIGAWVICFSSSAALSPFPVAV